MHSPGPGRAPQGWRPVGTRAAHDLGRTPPPPGRVGLGLGAHAQRGAPTAAAAGLAGRRRQPELRPSLPAASTTGVPAFARGKKKKKTPDAARAWVCGKGPEGRVLAPINSKILGTELLEKVFEKRPQDSYSVCSAFRISKVLSHTLISAPDSEGSLPASPYGWGQAITQGVTAPARTRTGRDHGIRVTDVAGRTLSLRRWGWGCMYANVLLLREVLLLPSHGVSPTRESWILHVTLPSPQPHQKLGIAVTNLE